MQSRTLSQSAASEGDNMSDVQPGWYRASDGRDYPIPSGQYMGSDGQLHPLPPLAPAGPAAGASPGQAPAAYWKPASSPGRPAWRWDGGSITFVAGTAAVTLGAFMPWASVGPFTVNGTDGDGVLTLVGAFIAGGLGIGGFRNRSRGLVIAALVVSVLITLIAIYDLADLASVADENDFGIEARPGGGLLLTCAGGVAAVVGAALGLRSPTPPPESIRI